MAEYRVVIAVPINGISCYFDLDTCTTRSVSSEARIATHPIQSGVEISDHMWTEAKKFSLHGSFSLNGRAIAENDDGYNLTAVKEQIPSADEWWDDWVETTKEGRTFKSFASENNRLIFVESLFEWIQSNGVLCDIMMTQTGANKGSALLFKKRSNMALESITWNERLNSLSFDMNWKEILTVDKTIDKFEMFAFEELYPNTGMPETRSLGKVLQESGQIEMEVIRTLIDAGYIAKADAKAFTQKGSAVGEDETGKLIAGGVLKGALAGAIISATIVLKLYVTVGGSALIAAAGGALSIISTLTGVGVAIGLGYGIYVAIKAAVNNAEKRKRLEEGFNLIQNYHQYVDDKTLEIKKDQAIADGNYNQKDLGRLQQLLRQVKYQTDTVLNNVEVYQFGEKPGDFPILVGSDYLCVRVNYKNTDSSGAKERQIGVSLNSFSIELFEGTTADGSPIGLVCDGNWPVVTTLDAMNRGDNVLYVSNDNQYEVYLYNPSLYTDKTYRTQIPAEAYELKSYCLIVSNGNIQNNMKTLHKKIIEILNTQGFDVKE